MTTVIYEKAKASDAAVPLNMGGFVGTAPVWGADTNDGQGYFGIDRKPAALDRGLADVNAALRKEITELHAETKRLTEALEAISGAIAIYRAHQP